MLGENIRKTVESSQIKVGSKHSVKLAQAVGGQLNPMWVEWLMGFPLGWTVLDASEMPSFRKSRSISVAKSER